jgi:hypothetical protein
MGLGLASRLETRSMLRWQAEKTTGLPSLIENKQIPN